ncbi:MAG TPA: hypothetical protein PKN48_01065 [Bacteroidales bacterium]|nr:hypothetical protein [Bacteroidales bacterium]
MIYNILDYDPILSAQAHCDQDVITSIFLITKDLSFIHWALGSPFKYRLLHDTPVPIDQNMCTINKYRWASIMLNELLNQYNIRYQRQHKLANVIKLLQIAPTRLPNSPFGFKLTVPVRFRSSEVVVSYRAYYQQSRKKSKWKRGVAPPEWWTVDQMSILNQFRYKNIDRT